MISYGVWLVGSLQKQVPWLAWGFQWVNYWLLCSAKDVDAA